MNALHSLGKMGGPEFTLFRSSCFAFSGTLLTVISLLASPALGQPKWVKDCVKQSESLTFPNDVPAVSLYMSSEFSFKSAKEVRIHVCSCVKILTPDGRESGLLKAVTDESRKVNGLKGWLIGRGKDVVELEKQNIVEVGEGGAGNYVQSSVLTAAFPDINPGETVAYEYDIDETTPFDNTFHTFVVQQDLPVVYACLDVNLQSGWKLEWTSQLLDSLQPVIGKDRYQWEIRKLAARPPEFYMPPWPFASRSISFLVYDPSPQSQSGFRDWRAAAKGIEPILSKGVVVDDSIRQKALDLTANLKTASAKVSAIGTFVRDQIRYVAVEIGPGRFEPRRADLSLANKFGDCKDKVALMRSLLKAVEIPSEPVLVSVDEPVNDKVPSPFQFNHCIVAMPLSALDTSLDLSQSTSGGWTFFDPTNESIPFGMLPGYLAGTKGLKVSETDSQMVVLPSLAPDHYKSEFRCAARLSASGHFESRDTIISWGLAAAESRHALNATSFKDRLADIRHMFSTQVTNPVIFDYQCKTDEDSTWESFALTGDNIFVEAGDLKLLKVNLFDPGTGESPAARPRVHAISFGPSRTIATRVIWTIPSGWTVDRPPSGFAGQCPLASENCVIEVHDSIVNFRSTSIFTGGTMPPGDYATAREFISSHNAVTNLRLSLKSK